MTITLDTTSLYSGKGFDVQSMVQQVLQSQRGQETLWKNQQTQVQKQTAALNDLCSQIATLYSDANHLRDLSGVFGSKTASSSNTGVVVATATSAATTSDYVLRIQQLASSGVAFSSPLPTDVPLPSGTLTISVGEATKTVDLGDSHSSWSELADAINQLNMGVTAGVQTDATGTRLAVRSNSTGAAANVAVSSSTSQMTFKNVAGTNAIIDINGVPYESASNTVSGAIPGVTLSLSSAAPDTDVGLHVAPDAGTVAQAITTFVSDYNSMISSVNSQFTYNPATGVAGALSGDSSVGLVQQQLLSMASISMDDNGSIDSLHALGITMSDEGTLEIDSTALNDALTNNFPALANFFQGSGSFGEQLGTLMTSLNDPINGPLALDLKSARETNRGLTDQINDFEERLSARQEFLLNQYSQINAQLQALPGLQDQILAALDSLSGFYGSSKHS
jgi:flagellar hook-associated protein 2